MSIFSKLPPFPRDPMSQVVWIDKMKEILTNRDLEIKANEVDVVTLSQGTEPSQGDWETAYTAQTGKSLPIPPAARLIWFNTDVNQVGAIYGTLSNSNGVVYLQQNRYSKGNIIDFDVAIENGTISVSYAIGEVLTDHPSASVFLSVPARLLMSYYVSATLNSSTGSWGTDFLLNGSKVGSQYYSVPDSEGITRRSTTGPLLTNVWTPVLDPGSYIIQPIFGVISGTPVIELFNTRQVYVKAVAQ